MSNEADTDSSHHATRRFVVLHHTGAPDGDHFDLMIDNGATLRAWRVNGQPEAATRATALDCRALADHRRAYLDYEGEVSGGRGRVRRHDTGCCTIRVDASDSVLIDFDGSHLKGTMLLSRKNHHDDQWRLRRA